MSELFHDPFDWEPKPEDLPYYYRDFQPVAPLTKDTSEAALHQVRREIYDALGELDNLRVELLRLENPPRQLALSAQQVERYVKNAARSIRRLMEGT